MSDTNVVAGVAQANVVDTAESLLTKGEHFVEAVGHLAKLVGVEIGEDAWALIKHAARLL